ncbi:amidohydrolase family protein [Saccharopolyspora sp. 6V]|uniref:amidohydrolase family protein n=1 Tax=Saccharopolyspora sp. 6V TaxID=2877239 RepID=UPI001CD6A954|nr:amidohydrolase family protein [Saccharopolyspora sp. 6V]MCA1192607.1 amidohydrolase family protein [Saccharopolyspora sp. 6V]
MSGPDDAERYLAWRVAAGSDLIKIIIEDPAITDVPALAPDALAALVAGAHARGLRTVAHVVTADSFTRGLDAGVDVLTHAPIDRPLPEPTVRRMVENRTIASPTLVMMRGVTRARFGDRADEAFGAAVESVRRMHAAGVPIVAGTDANAAPGSPAPVAHGSSLHDELQLLGEAGLSPTEALISATSGAAAALQLDDRGTVTPGRRADLLLVDGDPTEDLAAARTPAGVWVAGRQVV